MTMNYTSEDVIVSQMASVKKTHTSNMAEILLWKWFPLDVTWRSMKIITTTICGLGSWSTTNSIGVVLARNPIYSYAELRLIDGWKWRTYDDDLWTFLNCQRPSIYKIVKVSPKGPLKIFIHGFDLH